MIKEACEILKKLSVKDQEIKLSINLSLRQINDRQLFEFIQNSVNTAQVNPKKLELELTEGVLIDNYDKVQYLLDGVRKLGISVSIDDFGTGYSSLTYLHKLPIDRLKIDRSFVKELNENSQDSNGSIILAAIAMANSLKLDVIAEGVETAFQKDFFKQNNCNVAKVSYLAVRFPITLFVVYLKIKKRPSIKVVNL